MKQILLIISGLVLLTQQVGAQKQLTIGFYNVENLFDTVDNKYKEDEDFLPEGKLKWNTKRYETKLDHLAKVISELGGNELPDVLGMCEVENRVVVQDLISQPLLKPGKYDIAHFESPDERGIDVALIFKKKVFTLIESKAFKINFPEDPKDKTRDILLVKLVKNKKDTICFIVNHWPSRLGGTEISEPKRRYVAKRVREVFDSLLAKNFQQKVIIMGDFNDEPSNKSISEDLKCKFDKSQLSYNDLYNPMMDLKNAGKGSIVYRKENEMIDQFMLSQSLCFDGNKMHYISGSAQVNMPDYLVETEEKYKGSPLRTYAGAKYLGGYSDHFAVSIKLTY
jgi:predicted extracellular nuclease